MRGVRERGYDGVSLVSGVVILALGGLLILDQAGVLELDAGWFAAAFTAALGAILVASGLFERGE